MSFWSRLVNALRGDGVVREVDEELESHIAEAIEEGRDPGEARRALGSPLRHREESRDIRLIVWPAELVQDLRFGFRMLRRSPGFSFLAILCLTLGIGANAAVFSWIEGILFHPYPLVQHEERMFALAGTTRGEANIGLSYPDYLDFQKNCTLIDSFIVDRIVGTTLSIGERAERASEIGRAH